MKKFYKLLILVIFLFFAQNTFAAWTIETSISGHKYSDGSKLFIMYISAVSDGTDPAEFNFSDELVSGSLDMNSIYGGIMYEVITDPGIR